MKTPTEESIALKRATRLHWQALIVISVALTLLPHVCVFAKLPPAHGLAENRVLAAKPTFPRTVAQLKAYPSQLDDYIQDNFPLRANLIVWSNLVRYSLGYSGSDHVLVGKRGWLFYNNGDFFKFWRNFRLTGAATTAWVKDFSAKLDGVNRKGIRLYLLFPPYKETIYPENLPFWLRVSGRTELDEILDGLKAAGLDSHLIDVRKQLLAAKTPYRSLYYKFDTHWNPEGAYIAYCQLIERFQKDFPDLKPLPLTALPLRKRGENGDLAFMLGIGSLVPVSFERGDSPDVEPNITWLTEEHNPNSPHIIHTGSHNGRTLLLTKDSYSSLLLPFLVAHFERIIVTYVADGFFRQELIDRFHPDIVLIECVENYSGSAF